MFVICKGSRNADGGMTSRERLSESFETEQRAREYLRTTIQFQFSKFWHDKRSAIWWGRMTAMRLRSGSLSSVSRASGDRGCHADPKPAKGSVERV